MEHEILLVPSTPVAGTRHIADIRSRACELSPSTSLDLVRDAGNPYDPWAVEVHDRHGSRLGYVSCEYNEIVGRLLDGGAEVGCRVVKVAQCDNWTRIDMEVVLYA